MVHRYTILSLVSLLLVGSGVYVFKEFGFHSFPGSANFSSNQVDSFSAAKEFPNYFAQLGKTPEEIQQKLEKVFGHILDRTVVISYSQEKQSFEKLHYFQAVAAQTKQMDPQANIYVSGGSIRSGMAYIYRKIHEGVQKSPPVSPLATLNQILQDKSEIPDWEWRGVGSDMDLLLETPNKSEALKSRLLQITNSALDQFTKGQMIDDSRLSLIRSVVLQGDVKDYAKQIQNSSNQGGSSLDWLGFDLQTKQIKNPSRDPLVFQNFVQGKYSYLPAVDDKFRTDPADTILRGARPLFELPFLTLSDDSQFLQELKTLLKAAKEGKHISKRALGEFDKMSRNSFEGGAHNRLYRSTQEVDRTLRAISDHFKIDSHIPEFADHFNRQKDKPAQKFPEDLKMPLAEFLATHTDKGRVFHGTRSFDSALAILRSGFLISSSEQGQANLGRGVYTTKLKAEASQHSNQGPVFELSIRTEAAPTVVDWKRIQNDPRMAPVIRYAEETKRDVFEVLAREYGVDIVVHSLPLIQNMAVLKKNEGLKFLIENLRQEKTEELRKLLQSENNSETLKKAIDILLVISNVDKLSAVYGEKTQTNIKEHLMFLEKNLTLMKYENRGRSSGNDYIQTLLVFQQLQKEYRVSTSEVVNKKIIEYMTDMIQDLKTMAPPSTWQQGRYRGAVFSLKGSLQLLASRGKVFENVRNQAEQTILARHQEILEMTVKEKNSVLFDSHVELINRHYPEWAQRIQSKQKELFEHGMRSLVSPNTPKNGGGGGLRCEQVFGL